MNAKRILIIGGAYGSGKSEIALNLAEQMASIGQEVVLADLDFVNPYFRSRELAKYLDPRVEIISTAQGYEGADLPAISGRIAANLRLGTERLIIDLGGDPVGAKILRSFAEEPPLRNADFWLVINPHRPFTAKPDQIVAMVEAVAESAGLQPTGLIANPNLLTETTPEMIQVGLATIRQAACQLGLPIKRVVVEQGLLESHSNLERIDPDVPVLPLSRHLLSPWQSKS